MSSRAVRKATGHTTRDDLAQVLQKVGIGKDEDHDDEFDLVIPKTNDQRRNLFEMLADDNDDDDNDGSETNLSIENNRNDDAEQQEKQQQSKSKRKRKPKKKNNQVAKVDQIEDEFLIVSNESTQESTAINATSRAKESSTDLFNTDQRFLNPINEMKKRFGSNIVEQIERENNSAGQTVSANMSNQRRRAYLASQQRPASRLTRHNAFITPKLGWPAYFKYGLSMKTASALSETASSGNYFQFDFDKDYQRLQIQFLDYVDQHNIQGIMDILRHYPYHIDALIHLSDFSRTQDDTPTAAELIERALYGFQQSFHPLFSITRGDCRLEYRIQENRSFFICLFKNIIYVGERGCSRTALEFSKVLLSLDPKGDPLAILLLFDYYCIRSEEYNYLIKFYNELNECLNLDGLPNFAYSLSLAYFRLSLFDKANDLLQNALIRFPTVLKYLLDKLSVRPDRIVEQCRYFTTNDVYETNALKCVEQLYAVRICNEWKDKSELEFLQTNVHEVIKILEINQDSRINQYRTLRETCYRRTPINVCRHIVLSESNEIRGFLPNDLENNGSFYSSDPFPPRDSIASFQRPERPTMHIDSSYNGLNILLRSLIPNFNLENFLVPDNAQGATANAPGRQENDAGLLQALQESIRMLIRDIGVVNVDDNQTEQSPPDNDDGNNNEFD